MVQRNPAFFVTLFLSEQTQVTFLLRTHILQSVVRRYFQRSSQLQVKLL